MKKILLAIGILGVVVLIAAWIYKAYAPTGSVEPSAAISVQNSNTNAPEVLKPTFKITGVPDTVKPGDQFQVNWQIDIAESQPTFQTSVYYGPDSQKTPITDQSYPGQTKVSQGTIPGTFSGQIQAGKSGKIYLRAQVLIGGQNYWSDEKNVLINK